MRVEIKSHKSQRKGRLNIQNKKILKRLTRSLKRKKRRLKKTIKIKK